MSNESIGLKDVPEESNQPLSPTMSESTTPLLSTATEPEWDEKAFAKLVGFDDEDLEDEEFEDEEFSYGEIEPPSNATENINTAISNENNIADENILSDEELFDSPYDNPTPKKLSGNPFAKLAVVSFGLFIAFGTAGYFLTQIMTAGSQVGKGSEREAQAEAPTENFEDPIVEASNTEGELKTALALAHQEDDMKALAADNGKESLPLTADEPESPAPAVAVQPPPPPAPPVYQEPAVSRVRSTASTGRPAVEPAPLSPTEQLNNAMAQWQSLSQLGSYKRPAQDTTPPDPATITTSPQSGQFIQTAFSSSALATSPVETSGDLASNGVYTAPEPLVSQENRVLQGIPVRRANIGLSASGVLSTPIVWTNTEAEQRFVVVLETPLINEAEQVVFETGTSIVFRLNGVQDNGLIDASAISVILKGIETPLPQDSLVARSSQGPLIAQNAGNDNADRSPNQIEEMILGALSNVGENLLQSSDSISISNGDFSYSSNSGDNNLLGAAIQGAASPVLEKITQQISDRNTQALAQTNASNLWYLSTGETIQVYVNLPMEF